MSDSFVDLAGTARLWTHSSGKGYPVVLLNGGPGMADYLQPVAELMDQTKFAVHRYEQRGCGRSTSSEPITLESSIGDLEFLRQHWGFSRWIVIGHSWGADLGLAYALKYPDSVTGLICLAGGRVHNDRHWHQVYDDNKHKEQIPPSAGEPNYEVNRIINDEWKQYCRRPELLTEIAASNTPSIFLMGEHDVRPSWPTEQISSLMQNASLQFIKSADHNIWQQNPDDLRHQMHQFMITLVDQ